MFLQRKSGLQLYKKVQSKKKIRHEINRYTTGQMMGGVLLQHAAALIGHWPFYVQNASSHSCTLKNTCNSILWTILYCNFILKPLTAAEFLSLSFAVKKTNKQLNQCCSMLMFAIVEEAQPKAVQY